jgi:nucleoside-diphosphate-sugar epimerase
LLTLCANSQPGILGREIVHALGKDQKQWSTIHAVSRAQKETYPPTVKHRHVDLTGSVNMIANELKGVEAEYLFFAAYIQKDSEQENWDVNGAILKNFLEALKITGASKKLKRVLLVTGAKQYGVHLGQVKNPMDESDPWLEGSEWPPNFYYNQQQILKKQAASEGWEWVWQF